MLRMMMMKISQLLSKLKLHLHPHLLLLLLR
jgi:hypothetical protein